MEEKLTAKQRVELELKELDERIVKLEGCLCTSNLDFNIAERYLLSQQLEAMRAYRCALAARLSIWRDDIPKKEARGSCNFCQ